MQVTRRFWLADILCCHHRFFFWYFIMLYAMILQENPVKRICQRFQCVFSYGWFQFTFPDGDAMPTHCNKFVPYLIVTLLISSDFIDPKLTVCMWYFAALRVLNFEITDIELYPVSMPKATIHKDASPVFPHHDVRFTR